MIRKHSTSKFATKLKFKLNKPNKKSQQNLNLNSTNPTKHQTKIIRYSKTKCEKCRMECIQNEESLKHRHNQTELWIK